MQRPESEFMFVFKSSFSTQKVRHGLLLALLAFALTSTAQTNLSEGQEAYNKRQYIEARKILQPLAEQNDPAAMGLMGEMLMRGLGGSRDELKAREYIQKANELGDLPARFTLGRLMLAGSLVPRDEAKGLALIREAAEKGHVAAQAYIGSLIATGTAGYTKDEAVALTWFKVAAEKKEPSALSWMAIFHENGLGGLPQDNLLGLDYYKKAAELNHSPSMTAVGRMYAIGKGVTPDGFEALKWLRKAAFYQEYPSYAWIASVYEFGRGGVAKNPVLAYAWYAAIPSNASATTVKNSNDGKERLTKLLSPSDLQEAEKQSKQVVSQNVVTQITQIATDLGRTPAGSRKGAYGSGVVVSARGQVLTNEHVIQGCEKIRLQPQNIEVRVVSKDAKNDLALLQTDNQSTALGRGVNLRSGRGLRLGDEVVVLGYPLRGVLSAGTIVTSGIVNALSGMANDTSAFQMSATVQPGSSGGPVFDRQGQLVGIVRARLLPTQAANPQNVNFAINLATLTGFLDAHSVDYNIPAANTAANAASLPSVGDLVSKVQSATVQVECF
jgi:uncharacterized protein